MVRVRRGATKERLQAFGVSASPPPVPGSRGRHRSQDLGGVGVERIFRCTRRRSRRSSWCARSRAARKLYFLRRLAGKAARIRESGASSSPGRGETTGVKGPRPTLEREIRVLAGGAESSPVSTKPPRSPGWSGGGRGRRVSSPLQIHRGPARLQAFAARGSAAGSPWCAGRALAIGVGAASVREIDRLNIRRASISRWNARWRDSP